MNEQKTYRQPFNKHPGATELLLVRHGQSRAASLERPYDLVNGQGDPELSPEGVQQAEHLADRLVHQKIDALYVTYLKRTAETAAPLVRRTKLEPQVEADLREVHLGDWEGGLFGVKAAESDPVFLEMLNQGEWGVIPGGESTEALRSRIQAALKRISKGHPDQTVMIVSHGGVIGQILSLATGARPFAFRYLDNSSISRVILAGEEMRVRSVNDTSHIGHTFSSEAAPPT